MLCANDGGAGVCRPPRLVGHIEHVDALAFGGEIEQVCPLLAGTAAAESVSGLEPAQEPTGEDLDLVDLAVVGRHVGATAYDHRPAQARRLKVIGPAQLSGVGVAGGKRVAVGGEDEHGLVPGLVHWQPNRQVEGIDADARRPQRRAILVRKSVEDAPGQGKHNPAGKGDSPPSITGTVTVTHAVSAAVTSRRGVALVIIVLVLGVISMLLAATAWQATASRRLLERRQHQLQATWLARSGFEVAAGRLLADPARYGGKVSVMSVALLDQSTVSVTIRRVGQDSKPATQTFTITSEARYPTGGRDVVVRSITRQVRLIRERDRTRVEIVRG